MNLSSDSRCLNGLKFSPTEMQLAEWILKNLIFFSEPGLKGQYNSAQGKRSVALDWNENGKIVRMMSVLKTKSLFRTIGDGLVFSENDVLHFRPKKIFTLIIMFTRTVFLLHSLPRALPWARLIWPFRPRKYPSAKPAKFAVSQITPRLGSRNLREGEISLGQAFVTGGKLKTLTAGSAQSAAS